ncbi:hypothetical protein [Acinetobacter sp. ANC 4470]|uniref:hypothetical protein n=1 Tax=Acinetobacter sp. ANC 4470 TaxID=1977881 RepID=UPI00148A2379|nr:hypothetical protein [Acinetobacter sp. ANC 4470]
MLLNKILKSFSMIRDANKPSHIAEAMVKMEITIARLQQTKQVDLLRTDYLE